MKKLSVFLFFVLSWATSALELPPLSGPVVDEAGILRGATVRQLDRLLRSVHHSNAVQIQILTLNSLGGVGIEEVAISIVDRWKLGENATDKGILFLIVPSDRKMRIEVGDGLEGDIPDITAKRIIADVVTPHFRRGDFDSGVVAGVAALISAANPSFDFSQSGLSKVKGGRTTSARTVVLLFIVMVVIFMLGGGGRRRRLIRGATWAGAGYGMGSGWSRGSGWSGGGGGGWSGGGGGFSGGGASGSW